MIVTIGKENQVTRSGVYSEIFYENEDFEKSIRTIFDAKDNEVILEIVIKEKSIMAYFMADPDLDKRP